MALRRRHGVWYVDFRYTDPCTGQPQRLKRSAGRGATKKEARTLERRWRRYLTTPPELRDDHDAPPGHQPSGPEPEPDPQPEPPIDRSQTPFDTFAWHFFALHVETNCKPSSTRCFEGNLRVHLIPFFGQRPIGSITAEDVARFKAIKRKERAAKSVNNYLALLSRLFRAAVDWGYIDRNPSTGVGLLRLPPSEFQFWDAEQSDRFLEVARQRERSFADLFLCALRTGMRFGELIALCWKDLDLDVGRIHVRRSHCRGALTTPKSGRGRTVPMSPELREVLAARKARRSERRGRGGDLRNELVFPARGGGYLTTDKVKKPFWRATAAAGLPRIRFHDLRHSFASQLAMAGVPLVAVQQYLGHADIGVTMRYAHLSPVAKQDYIGCLDSGVVQGASTPAVVPVSSQNGHTAHSGRRKSLK